MMMMMMMMMMFWCAVGRYDQVF